MNYVTGDHREDCHVSVPSFVVHAGQLFQLLGANYSWKRSLVCGRVGTSFPGHRNMNSRIPPLSSDSTPHAPHGYHNQTGCVPTSRLTRLILLVEKKSLRHQGLIYNHGGWNYSEFIRFHQEESCTIPLNIPNTQRKMLPGGDVKKPDSRKNRAF